MCTDKLAVEALVCIKHLFELDFVIDWEWIESKQD